MAESSSGAAGATGTTQSAPGAPGESAAPGSMLVSFLPLVLIVVLFYFLMIRPGQQQQKKTREMQEGLKKGEKVVTSGGLYGWVVGVNEKDDIVVLRIADNVKVEVTRKSVTGQVPAGASSIGGDSGSAKSAAPKKPVETAALPAETDPGTARS